MNSVARSKYLTRRFRELAIKEALGTLTAGEARKLRIVDRLLETPEDKQLAARRAFEFRAFNKKYGRLLHSGELLAYCA